MTEHDAAPGRAGGAGGVRVRFAPSPSGDLHVGNVRTALYDWAFARSAGGRFVLRIEDTDQTRVTPEYIDSAQDTLRWLGLDWDEGPGVGGPFGPYLQSERLDIYTEWVDRFLKDGHAYHCYCSQEELAQRREAARKAGGPSGYDGHCRNLTPAQIAAYQAEGRQPVVRFTMPPGSTTFTDLIRGEVTFDHAHVPDFVLARADGAPLYTLAVAVDDVLMKITHVVRGEDLLSSTPRQIAVYRAMGVPEAQFPVFAHLPYVLGPNGQKLSKRNGVVSINWYREPGLPAGGDLQLPGAARVVAGGEPGVVHDGRDGRRVRPGPGEQERGPVRRAQAGGDQRGQDPRARAGRFRGPDHPVPGRGRAGRHPAHGRRSRTDRGQRPAHPGADRHSRRGARACSGSCSSTRRSSAIDPEDAARALTPDAEPVLAAAEEALAGWAVDVGGHRARAARRAAGGRAGPQAAGGVQRGAAGRDHGAARPARRCSSRSSCWAATGPSAASPGRGSSPLAAVSPADGGSGPP